MEYYKRFQSLLLSRPKSIVVCCIWFNKLLLANEIHLKCNGRPIDVYFQKFDDEIERAAWNLVEELKENKVVELCKKTLWEF